MFAIIGFIVIFMIGAWLTFIGVASNLLSLGLVGRPFILGIITGLIGLVVIYFDIINAPFELSFKLVQ